MVTWYITTETRQGETDMVVFDTLPDHLLTFQEQRSYVELSLVAPILRQHRPSTTIKLYREIGEQVIDITVFPAKTEYWGSFYGQMRSTKYT